MSPPGCRARRPRGHPPDRGHVPGDQGLRALHELGKIQVKGIKDAIIAYVPEELDRGLPRTASTRRRSPGLQKLKESIFVPNFQFPREGRGQLTPAVEGIFSEISRAIEELASDYHDEYEFKKYLQDKWNALMGSL